MVYVLQVLMKKPTGKKCGITDPLLTFGGLEGDMQKSLKKMAFIQWAMWQDAL